MTSLELGARPIGLTVTLVKGADFVTGLDSLDGDWPDTAVIRLVFNDTETTAWTATITGSSADFNEDKDAVDALIGRLPEDWRRAQLIYTDGSTDLVWAHGAVEVVS